MDRETIVEAAVSTVAVLVFVAAVVVVGTTYGNDDLSSSGGLAIVATIVGFVLVMLVVGILLDRR